MADMANPKHASTSEWREERRRDRLASAQIARDNETASLQARIARDDAKARQRREQQQQRLSDQRAARKRRAERRAERAKWLNSHQLGLLFVPVIIVPAALAWTAMAAFGYQVFGPAGMALPAFSEGAMWAFAAAATITRRRHPERPVWHLRLGTAVFAGFGAALNFIHGATPVGHELRGPAIGVVMALISVAGVIAHQFVTAGPRRSRAAREAGRLERMRARRERRIRRAAERRAHAVVGADGNVRLVYRPGVVTLARRWHGGSQLEDVPAPWPLAGRPVPIFAASEDAPASAPEKPAGVHLASALRVHSAGVSGVRPDTAPAGGKRARKTVRRGTTEEDARKHFATELDAGQVPSQRRIQRELHVGQDRAGELRRQMIEQIQQERGVVSMERRRA